MVGLNKMAEPLFSIVIPTYQRPKQLTACLHAVTQIDYPLDQFEVIVVDDNGGDDPSPAKIVAQFEGAVDLKLVSGTHAGAGLARNLGVSFSKGKFLFFTDDDCTPHKDILKLLEMRFQQTPDVMIGGKVINGLEKNLYAHASQLLIDYLYLYFNRDSNNATFLTSNNMAVARSGFLTIEGFDKRYYLSAGEDRDLCQRWVEANNKIVYAPEVIIYHWHDLSFTKLFRQHFNYGCGSNIFHKSMAVRKTAKIQFEKLSFYFNLIKYPLTQKKNVFFITLLFIFTQIANVSGFFWQEWNSKKPS